MWVRCSLIDPKIWDAVDHRNLRQAPLICPEGKHSEGDGDTDIGNDDLPPVVRLENNGGRLEV